MDAVLGLSVTPSAVGLVLVEGQDADGSAVDGDAFEIYPGRHSTPEQTSDEAAAAVLRTEAIAASRGQRLQSIGVTWSEDAGRQASLLLKSLGECGFENVVPVRLSEASEALAWGVAEVVGYDVTAVCLVESETVIALVLHTRQGAVQTAVNHAITTEEALIRWLNAVFAKADWSPEALVMVGSGVDFDDLLPRLEDVLAVPVFAPAEAELALARGAALASAHATDPGFDETGLYADDHPSGGRSRPLAQSGPLAMLVAGTVAFVVSVSAAISMQLSPEDTTPEPTPAAKSSPEAAAVSDVPPIAPPVPVAPPPVEPAAEAAPPPVEPPEQAPEPITDVAPPPESVPPAPAAPEAPPAPPAPDVPALPGLPPESLAPGLVPAQPTPVPDRRGILQKIRDKLHGNDAAVPPAAPPPGAPAADPAFVAPPAEPPPPG